MFTKMFKDYGIFYRHKKDIANKFNTFFTEIEPKLSSQRQPLNKNLTKHLWIKYIITSSNFNMFMKKLLLVLSFFQAWRAWTFKYNMEVLHVELTTKHCDILTQLCSWYLPTNNNLMIWGKRSNSKCELCSHHEILLHTLNNCPTMLKDGRYTCRHNSVLRHTFTLTQNLSKETDWIIHSDLPGHNNKCGIYIIPTRFVLQPRYCHDISPP